MSDFFIGHSINGYIIQEKIGKGCIGSVYKAVKEELDDVRAVKFVPMDVVSKKNNWEQEIIKVNKLRRTEGVVHYHTHDTIEVDGVEYLYIMWDYIPGKSLKNYISSNSLTMQMVVDVVIRSLSVFHACKQLGIQHADFHSGNILIEEPDPLNINENIQKVWIATVYKGNIIKNLIMDCQSYTKYRPNETTGGIFVSWRRKEELPTGA